MSPVKEELWLNRLTRVVPSLISYIILESSKIIPMEKLCGSKMAAEEDPELTFYQEHVEFTHTGRAVSLKKSRGLTEQLLHNK